MSTDKRVRVKAARTPTHNEKRLVALNDLARLPGDSKAVDRTPLELDAIEALLNQEAPPEPKLGRADYTDSERTEIFERSSMYREFPDWFRAEFVQYPGTPLTMEQLLNKVVAVDASLERQLTEEHETWGFENREAIDEFVRDRTQELHDEVKLEREERLEEEQEALEESLLEEAAAWVRANPDVSPAVIDLANDIKASGERPDLSMTDTLNLALGLTIAAQEYEERQSDPVVVQLNAVADVAGLGPIAVQGASIEEVVADVFDEGDPFEDEFSRMPQNEAGDVDLEAYMKGEVPDFFAAENAKMDKAYLDAKEAQEKGETVRWIDPGDLPAQSTRDFLAENDVEVV